MNERSTLFTAKVPLDLIRMQVPLFIQNNVLFTHKRELFFARKQYQKQIEHFFLVLIYLKMNSISYEEKNNLLD